MKGLLGEAGYLAAVVGIAAAVLGKWIPGHVAGPAGIAPQAFRACSKCGSVTAHLIHSPTCRRCLTCDTLTNPGDPQ